MFLCGPCSLTEVAYSVSIEDDECDSLEVSRCALARECRSLDDSWQSVDGSLLGRDDWPGCLGTVRLTKPSHREDRSSAIAMGRYAKGEIGKEEFDHLKKDLK